MKTIVSLILCLFSLSSFSLDEVCSHESEASMDLITFFEKEGKHSVQDLGDEVISCADLSRNRKEESVVYIKDFDFSFHIPYNLLLYS